MGPVESMNSESDDDDEEEDGDSEEDDSDGEEEDSNSEEDDSVSVEEGDQSDGQEKDTSSKGLKKKKSDGADIESGYGVSRGIDFQGVNFVINFDFPTSSAAYTHRIGRTARGGASGTALSFVSISPPKASTTLLEGKRAALALQAIADEEILLAVRMQQPRLGGGERDGGDVLASLGSSQPEDGGDLEQFLQPAPLMFNMKELDAFRYRVEDTLRSVTASSVTELRSAELKREILNSAQLKSFFAANPTDLKVLRHDKAVMHPIRIKDHLKSIPEYLIPTSMRSVASNANKKKKRKIQSAGGQSQEKRRQLSKSKDPLFSGGSNTNSSDAGAEKSSNSAQSKERVYSSSDTLGYSTSGRQKWKASHSKGKFSKHKGSTHGVKGSYTKVKGYR